MNEENLRKYLEKKIIEGKTEEEIRKIGLVKHQDIFLVAKLLRELTGSQTEHDIHLEKAKKTYAVRMNRQQKAEQHKKKLERERLYTHKVFFRVDSETANKLHSYGWGSRAECCRRGLKLFFKQQEEEEKQKQEEEANMWA